MGRKYVVCDVTFLITNTYTYIRACMWGNKWAADFSIVICWWQRLLAPLPIGPMGKYSTSFCWFCIRFSLWLESILCTLVALQYFLLCHLIYTTWVTSKPICRKAIIKITSHQYNYKANSYRKYSYKYGLWLPITFKKRHSQAKLH